MRGFCLLVEMHWEGSALQPAQQAYFKQKITLYVCSCDNNSVNIFFSCDNYVREVIPPVVTVETVMIKKEIHQKSFFLPKYFFFAKKIIIYTQKNHKKITKKLSVIKKKLEL